MIDIDNGDNKANLVEDNLHGGLESMTICIGALCDSGNSAVMVADRMVTIPHIDNLKLGNHTKKIHKFSDDCFTMNSKKLNNTMDIYKKAHKIKNKKENHFKIAEAYKSHRLDLAIESILETRGFRTYKEFIGNKNNMSDLIFYKLDKEIKEFKLNTIIMTVFYDKKLNQYNLGLLEDDGVYKNLNPQGCCAIGIKFEIVEFLLSKEGYNISNSLDETRSLLVKTKTEFQPFFDGIGEKHDVVCLSNGEVVESTI